MSDELDEQVGMCGITTKLPAGPRCPGSGADRSGTVVTCFEEPHGDEDEHVGLVANNGSPVGVYCW